MSRRGGDERPPIEIVGTGNSLTSTHTVEVGSPRPTPRRGRLLLIVAVVLGLLGVGLLTGEDDEPNAARDEPEETSDRGEGRVTPSTERTTTTTRRATTSTTTPPLGPIFGEPLEGVLLLSQSGSGEWTRIDLTTGVVDEIRLPTFDTFSTVTIAGGVVVPDGSGNMHFHPVLAAPGAEETAGREVEAVPLGPGSSVLRAGADRVWLFDQPYGGGTSVSTNVRLVDLTGEVLRSFTVPGFQSVATPRDVLVSRGGRVYVADEDGLRALTVGWLNGAIGDAAIVTTCDEDGECSLRLQPTDGGASRRLLDIAEPDAVFHEPAATAADGTVAIMQHDQGTGGQRLYLFGRDGAELGKLEVPGSSVGVSSPQWLPNDLGLVVYSGSGLQWIRPTGSGWEVEPVDIDVDGAERAESFLIITPG